MMRAPRTAAVLLYALCGAAAMPATAAPAQGRQVAVAAPAPARMLSHGRFVDVAMHMPIGEVRRFVFWFADGPDAAQRAARVAALRGDGAMVAVADTGKLRQALGRDGGSCIFSAGDVENFARYAQAYYRLPTYHAAILLGDGEGAALAYALLAQAPKDTFAGALSAGFCPQLAMAKAICAAGALRLRPVSGKRAAMLQPGAFAQPWYFAADARAARCPPAAVQGFAAAVPSAHALARDGDGDGDLLASLRTALRQIGARREASLPPPPADLAGLPMVEVPVLAVPAAGSPAVMAAARNAAFFAVFVSGDGGWAGLDKDVAAALAAAGIPVAGLDALRYFWSARTPQGFAGDLDRIVRYYARHWRRGKVLLIGFSQGADVLPAAINRLPATTRDMIALDALLSMGHRADYEFHLANWLGGGGSSGLPIAPEMARLPPGRTLCLYGEDDGDALCPRLPAASARVVKLPGDHHFNGDHARLAALIVRAAQARSTP